METKLNRKILGIVLLGIAGVFAAMMLINGIIFSVFTQGKTAYYISLFFSNSLFVILIIGILKSQKINIQDLGWRKTEAFPALFNIIGIWFATWICYFIYIIILSMIGITPKENGINEMISDPTTSSLIINIIAIAVVAPIVEETIFRGLLFGSLRPYFCKWFSVDLSALIF
jgi:membrane protease YdiL (CAAX protease family)